MQQGFIYGHVYLITELVSTKINFPEKLSFKIFSGEIFRTP